MSAGRPSARQLFAVYHLGLRPDGSHGFCNLADVAVLYQTDRSTISKWLKDAGIDPDTVGTVDFNLSALHVDAMFLADDDKPAFIDKSWEGYVAARTKAVPGQFFHDHDYDDL